METLNGIIEWCQGLLDQGMELFRDTCGPPLKAFHTPIDHWLGSVPMSVAMFCAIGLYVAAVIWVWTLKGHFVFRGAPGKELRYDLRIWATVVVLPYVVAYLVLGR